MAELTHAHYMKNKPRYAKLARIRQQALGREYFHANEKKWRKKVGIEKLREFKKRAEMRRIAKNGISDFVRRRRTKNGFLTYGPCTYLFSTYGIRMDPAEMRKRFNRSKVFRDLYNPYRESGWKRNLSPVLTPKLTLRRKPKTIDDFEWQSYGYHRSWMLNKVYEKRRSK